MEDGQGYLIAKVTGEWKLDAVRELIDALAEDCKARRCNRLLVDCLDVRLRDGCWNSSDLCRAANRVEVAADQAGCSISGSSDQQIRRIDCDL